MDYIDCIAINTTDTSGYSADSCRCFIVLLYTSNSSDSSAAPFSGSTKILTSLVNSSTGTESAAKEVPQIILAEIERRLNDTATLKRLAKTTDVSSQ